jgi:hypothetical protein
MTSNERLSRNQLLYREVNQRLRDLSISQVQVPWTDRTRYLCECRQDGCLETIDLTPAEYEYARSQPDVVVVCQGHESHGEVIERTDRFVLVDLQPRLA